MGYAVSTLIVSLCLYLIIRPFFQKKREWQTDDLKDDLDSLNLDQIYATLNELEMEYNMGKVPKEDYTRLKEQYDHMAAQKLKEEVYSEENGSEVNKGNVTKSEKGDLKLEDGIEQELEALREQRQEKQ